jgi:hypothetical protein
MLEGSTHTEGLGCCVGIANSTEYLSPAISHVVYSVSAGARLLSIALRERSECFEVNQTEQDCRF